MQLRLLFFIFFLIISFAVEAQQSFLLHGIVIKKGSTDRLAQVLITNRHTNMKMMSDELGWFKINVSVGDTLIFAAPDYTDVEQVVQSTRDMAVYMQPVIKLNQVTIQGKSEKQELNDVMQDYRKQGTFYNGKPPALSMLTSPLTGLYELFGKTPARARHFAQYSKDELEYSTVRKRFTKDLVKRITKIPDDELQNFMDNFTPGYDQLKDWNDYEMISYIRKSYTTFEKNKANFHEQRLPVDTTKRLTP